MNKFKVIVKKKRGDAEVLQFTGVGLKQLESHIENGIGENLVKLEGDNKVLYLTKINFDSVVIQVEKLLVKF